MTVPIPRHQLRTALIGWSPTKSFRLFCSGGMLLRQQLHMYTLSVCKEWETGTVEIYHDKHNLDWARYVDSYCIMSQEYKIIQLAREKRYST